MSSKTCTGRPFEPLPLISPGQLPGHLCGDPEALKTVVQTFPMRVNSYWLSLIKHPEDALARQVLPDPRELADPCTEADPLSEEKQSPAPLIVHRYPGRVIFLVSNQCAAYCRFCMRKRRVGASGPVPAKALDDGVYYIANHPEISEVVLSGGDPLVLCDEELTGIMTSLKAIRHVKILRIHTRVPSTWPQRITALLARRLAAFHPLFVNIQFNHPDEITPDAERACALLADAGIPLGSQTVLLKGINDDPRVLLELLEALLGIRVRPYYLHQIDRVPGTAHFHVPVRRGLELMAGLRGRLSGIAMPHYMVDLPGGGGKIELLADSIVHKADGYWIIRNFQGRDYRYPTD